MAEVLGLASGIAGLLSLTIEVYATTAKYIGAVKNASSTIQSILRELKSLKTVLTELDKLVEQADFQDVFRDRDSSFLSIEDSEEYKEILERIKAKLLKQASLSGFSGKLKTLVWPFSEERTMRMVEILRRHVSIFGQALSIDTFFTTSEILKEVRLLGRERKDKENSVVLDWLSVINMDNKQQDIYSRRHADTGTWLLENKSFLKWLHDDQGSLLWCPGEPGVGKTVLSSIVIDHLQSYSFKGSTGVAFFYCDYQNQSQQSALAIISSFVRQLVQMTGKNFSPLQELHETLTAKGNVKPTLNDVEKLLISICGRFDKVYIVIDALDECNLAQRKLLFPILPVLQRASISILTTSRPHAQDLERALKDHVKLEVCASELDIQRYVNDQVEQDEDLEDLLTDELKQKTVSTLVDKSNGM
jgi:ankyrin repeat domain-containing protein 50